jgi:hypothetical protein
MDPQIIRFLTQRLELSPQEVEALERGDTASVVTRRFASNPELAPLLALVNQPGPGAEARDQDDDSMDTRRPGSHRVHASRPDADPEIVRARRVVRRLRRDLEAADTIIHHIAKVFGACPACFGMSEECGRCHGHGVPGSVMPAREELLSWVEPALRRLGFQIIEPSHVNQPK